jgi:hypothetical protein
MAETKLHQILAVEKGIKTRVMRKFSDVYKAVQKPDLFSGLAKQYKPKDEDGDRFPPERKKVQVVASDLLKDMSKHLSELFDVTAQKDFANCHATADVMVDGQDIPLLREVPVTFLLFLEKQLTDLHTLVSKIPVLDASEDWTHDSHANIFKTAAILTTKTKKLQRPIVLHPPTKEHPAQTQLITEDSIIGHWETIRQSGALPAPQKAELQERIETLTKAVKFAREEANAAEASRKEVGRQIFEYLFETKA